MRVLIIGGTSFIGPHVVHGLHQQIHDVVVYHRGHHEPPLPADVGHIHHPDAPLGDRRHFDQFGGELHNVQPDVENVAAATVVAVVAKNAANQTYNVGEQPAYSEEEWIAAIGRVAGWQGQVVTVAESELPAHLRQYLDWSHHIVADSGRIRTELGYSEPIARDEALERTIAWQQLHPPAHFDPARFNYAAEDQLLDKYA